MKFTKKELIELDRCYAATYTMIDNKPQLLFASEGNGACYMFSPEDYKKTTVWEEPGGTMSIVPIPGKNGDFLAVQKFYRNFESENATIVWAHWTGSEWDVKNILKLPYVHRFDILTRNGKHYFIGATLCTSKTHKEDWSDPGKIYVAELPEDLTKEMELAVIKDGLTKNHGYSRSKKDDYDISYVTSENGVFRIEPPKDSQDIWKVECILDKPVSDIAVYDMDGDGMEELITIEPFHGGNFVVRKNDENGYKEVYRYPKQFDFGHVVWAGDLRGKPVVIGGYRRDEKELFYLEYSDGKYVPHTIDSDIGPSNITVLNGDKEDIIISANREVGKAAVYIVKDH